MCGPRKIIPLTAVKFRLSWRGIGQERDCDRPHDVVKSSRDICLIVSPFARVASALAAATDQVGLSLACAQHQQLPNFVK